jgi:hypothetical protein
MSSPSVERPVGFFVVTEGSIIEKTYSSENLP